jgi:fimbrial chaperone protein
MTRRQNIGQALLWGLAVFLTHAPATYAGSFAVNPVRVTLSAAQSVAAITVRNVGSEPTVIQLETSSWTQHDGREVLVPTTDVLATPPIITIQPGGARIIRVGLRRPADMQRELTYRLALRELPPPEPIAQGLRVALLISMPIFVLPPHPPAVQIHWRALRARDSQIHIQAANTGLSHVQLGQLDLALTNGEAIGTRNMSQYVLPDNSREWTVDTKSPPSVGTTVRISCQTDGGKVRSDVRVEDGAQELSLTTSGGVPR